MIPFDAVTAWGVDRPWPTREQVEQDLLLSRAICAIANDAYLGQELVLRGGTAFHKLVLPSPLRYSEDLDYVRRTAGGIAELTQSLTRLGSYWVFRSVPESVSIPRSFGAQRLTLAYLCGSRLR